MISRESLSDFKAIISKITPAFVAGAFSISVGGCGANNFPSYSKLDRLRLLAIEVDRPELNYDETVDSYTVQVLPLVSDIGGSGNLIADVQACLDPGVSLGASPSCTGSPSASPVVSITISPAVGQSADIFGDLNRTGQPSSGAVALTLPFPRVLWPRFSEAQKFNGVPAIIVVQLRQENGAAIVSGFRRILVSNKTSPNANPVLSDLKSNGTSLLTKPGFQSQLSFDVGNPPENYEYQKSDGSKSSFTESLEVTWFVSDGSVDVSRSRTNESVEWELPQESPPGGRKVVLVGVLRDGRGGVSWLIRNF